MTTTYRLNTKELSSEIILSIKEAFKDKEIEITVSDVLDETAYLLSTEENKKHLYKSIEEIEKGKGIPMTLAELQEKYLK
jgi:antitoxin YefM